MSVRLDLDRLLLRYQNPWDYYLETAADMIDESTERITEIVACELLENVALMKTVTQSQKVTSWFQVRGQHSMLYFVLCLQCREFYRVPKQPNTLICSPNCDNAVCQIEECAEILRGDQ